MHHRGDQPAFPAVEKTFMKNTMSLQELGFPVRDCRPGVLLTVHWRSVVWSVVGLAIYFTLLFLLTLPLETGQPQILASGGSIAVGVATALITWAHRRQVDDRRQVAQAVADMVSAWNHLRTSTGITAAIESNLNALHQYVPSGPPGRAPSPTATTLATVEQELRAITTPPSPADPGLIAEWIDTRYEAVERLNARLVALPGVAHLRPAATFSAHESVMKAYSDWDDAAQRARAAVVRWPALRKCVDVVQRHVRVWWVFAVNDPRYWETSPELRREREVRHQQAKQAAEALQEVVELVKERKLGLHPFRYRLRRFGRAAGVALRSTPESEFAAATRPTAVSA